MAQTISLWKKLRAPFARATDTCRLFTGCAWETIDYGLLGCRRCGGIHNCYAGTCTETQATEDGVVCCLTGLVTTSTLYATHEHSDNVCVYSHDPENLSSIFEAHIAHIPNIVTSILDPTRTP